MQIFGNSKQKLVDELSRGLLPLPGAASLDAVVSRLQQARVVLLGEATHGSAEFYRLRAEISKRLVFEHGFDAIAVEADWPDALRVSRFIRCRDGCADQQAFDALGGFQRFPLWMWRNREILTLVDALRAHNRKLPTVEQRAGFFGLDLYSLRSSMDAVIRYLDTVDADEAREARQRYACFDQLADNPQRYGYASSYGMRRNCEEEVVQQLVAMQRDLAQQLDATSPAQADELFYAQQNARVAMNAEAYYRAMYQGRNASWNLRDTHMADTLCALLEHLGRAKGKRAKVVAWAHNSHIGDASATELGDDGEINLGQLMRERLGTEDVFLLGFTTHTGRVTAASEWDSPAELKAVRESRPDSVENLLHRAAVGANAPRFLLPLRESPSLRAALSDERLLERAIGVIYLPESERASHYFHADAGRQFDALIHVDTTSALHPLDASPHWRHEEVPDTFPSGI